MRLHPDIFHVDFMTMEQMTEKRLAKNHITFNFWGDMSIALMNGKPALARSQWKHVETLFMGIGTAERPKSCEVPLKPHIRIFRIHKKNICKYL